ncbi:hypothetical protein KUTeg_012011 [Tegillarca granosa]|uniref:Uncharacterized protein n=1 Tax=Tegillarca granosa TaxID=220873 RepID=A0ABQ9EYA5_TEGGR|nr:hypothetical protein KUTeg_012011 [Tegillarca granosa]
MDPEHGCIDLGGAYVGQKQKRVLKLVKEFGLELYNINEKEKTVLNFRNSWSKFSGVIPPFWNPIKLLDLNHVLRTIDNMAKEIPADAPWKAPKAEEWDAMTMKEFINKICWTL